MNYLYPLVTLSDTILWQILNDRGEIVWEGFYPIEINPEFDAQLVCPDLIKCPCDDDRVLAAQEASLASPSPE